MLICNSGCRAVFCAHVCLPGSQCQHLESDHGLEGLCVHGSSTWSECRGVITSEGPARLAGKRVKWQRSQVCVHACNGETTGGAACWGDQGSPSQLLEGLQGLGVPKGKTGGVCLRGDHRAEGAWLPWPRGVPESSAHVSVSVCV